MFEKTPDQGAFAGLAPALSASPLCAPLPAPILNAFAQKIPASPTLAISEKASALVRQGQDVINLSVGEPDLPVPQWVAQAAICAIEQGVHTYTPVAGLLALRQAIAQKLARDNALSSYDPAREIIVGTGAKQVIFNALMVSINPGDKVLVPAPYWVSYPAMVHMAGGTCVYVPCTADQGFKITPTQLKSALTQDTRWVILNSPNNPSGAVYTAGELEALAQVLRAWPDTWILCDDIYEPMTYDGTAFTSLLAVAPDFKNRTLVVNGLSKSFSMTGWRLGYGAGPEELIEGMVRLQSHSTTGACCITQHGAIAALTESVKAQTFFDDQRQIFAGRRNTLVQGLTGPFQVIPPQGAFYVFAGCHDLLEKSGCQNDMALAHKLLEEALISCVPGTEFGMPGYLRFSYAVADEILVQASTRLRQWAAKLG